MYTHSKCILQVESSIPIISYISIAICIILSIWLLEIIGFLWYYIIDMQPYALCTFQMFSNTQRRTLYFECNKRKIKKTVRPNKIFFKNVDKCISLDSTSVSITVGFVSVPCDHLVMKYAKKIRFLADISTLDSFLSNTTTTWVIQYNRSNKHWWYEYRNFTNIPVIRYVGLPIFGSISVQGNC